MKTHTQADGCKQRPAARHRRSSAAAVCPPRIV